MNKLQQTAIALSSFGLIVVLAALSVTGFTRNKSIGGLYVVSIISPTFCNTFFH